MIKQRKTSFTDLIFFFVTVATITIYFLLYLTIRNESINIHASIQKLNNKRITYINKLNLLRSEQKSLSSQSRIERVARDKFSMHTPVPESLIIYMDDMK